MTCCSVVTVFVLVGLTKKSFGHYAILKNLSLRSPRVHITYLPLITFSSIKAKYTIQIIMAKIRSNSLPWMNSALRKEMNLRYKLLKHAQKYLKTLFTRLSIEDSETTLRSKLEKPKQVTGKANLKMLEIRETFGK